MKKLLGILVLILGFSSVLVAQDLSGLVSDFDALLTGITQDVAPTLPLSALGGEAIADATIDGFILVFPGLGITLGDGLGTVLADPDKVWDFALAMPSLLRNMADFDMGDYKIIPYPNLKVALGFGIGNDMDLILSGMYLPADLISEQAGAAVKEFSPRLGFSNIGVRVRKTIFKDKDLQPAVSLGLGYTYAGSEIGLTLKDQTMDMGGQDLVLNGAFNFATQVHILAFDFHVSKHMILFTPYAKLSAALFQTEARAKAELVATAGPSTQNISLNPITSYFDSSLLATLGIDVLFLNVNAVFDLGRFVFNYREPSMAGIDGNGATLNLAIKLQI